MIRNAPAIIDPATLSDTELLDRTFQLQREVLKVIHAVPFQQRALIRARAERDRYEEAVVARKLKV